MRDPFEPVALGPEHGFGFNYEEKPVAFDPRALRFLTRNERRMVKSFDKKKGEPMLVNLKAKVEGYDADNTLIKNANGEIPDLKEIVTYALRAAHPSDQQTNFKVKNERYLLLKRVQKVDEIELTEQERKSILDRVGMMYLQVEMIGRVGELLTPSATAPKKEEPKAEAVEAAPTEGA